MSVSRRDFLKYCVASAGALGLGGPFYGIVAVFMGVAVLLGTARGLMPNPPEAWARRYFLATLIYLPVVLGALVLDGLWL